MTEPKKLADVSNGISIARVISYVVISLITAVSTAVSTVAIGESSNAFKHDISSLHTRDMATIQRLEIERNFERILSKEIAEIEEEIRQIKAGMPTGSTRTRIKAIESHLAPEFKAPTDKWN